MNFKKSFIVLFACLFFGGFVFAENSNTGKNKDIDQSQNQIVEESQVSIPVKSETDFNFENSKDGKPRKKSSTAWVFIRMILTLALVVVIIFLLMNFFKKSGKMGNTTNDSYLRKVAHLNLSPGKSVQIVTLLDDCYILGVTDNSINLIGKVEDKELISAMNISADKASNSSKPKNFSEVLEMFLPSKSTKQTSATQTNIYQDSSNDISDFVAKQRSRMTRKSETKKK